MAEADDRWQIGFGIFEPEDEQRREALLAQGNGLLCARASAPEAAASTTAQASVHYAGLYRAGWYDEAPREIAGESAHIAALVNLPAPFALSISLDGKQWFGPDTPRLGYQQCLRMDRGRLQRDIHFVLGGQPCRLHEVRFLSMANPHLAVLRWTVTLPPGVDRLSVRSVLDGGVENSLIERNHAYEGARLFDIYTEHHADGRAALSARLCDPARRLAIAIETRCGDAAGHRSNPHWQSHWDGKRLTQETSCTLTGKHPLVIEKRIIVRVDHEQPEEPAAARSQALGLLPEEPFFRLCLEHERAWRRLWSSLPLQTSAPDLERALRLHAFHLLQTVSPNSLGHDLGFPPRGWHEGYYGQVFWDEVFAFPFLATHFPALARHLLGYRYRRLDEARRRARQAGLRGAMFPWRSAASGQEQTPPYQYNPLSGHWMPDHTDLQRHIGAAIAHDAWLLFLATGDEALLAGEAGELIVEIARFWASIATWDEKRGRYVIHGVTGPDEYHNLSSDGQPGLSNNTYTNLMAVWALQLGLQTLETLPDDKAEALCQRLALKRAELAHWRDICRSMYLPVLNHGVLDQFDGFEQLHPAPAEWQCDDRPRLDWMLEANGDRADRYRLSKQPDVLMLLYLLPLPALETMLERLDYPLDRAALQRTIAYHLANLTHESSLSKVVCAGALARFDTAASWGYFQQSLAIDLHAPPNGGTREGVHLGAMAGSLVVLQEHYLGIRPALDGLHVFPMPPAALGDIALDLLYRNAQLRISLQGRALRVHAVVENSEQTLIRHAAGQVWLRPGDSLDIPCERP